MCVVEEWCGWGGEFAGAGDGSTVATWYFLFSLSSSQILKLKSLIGIKFKTYVTLSVEKRGIISTSRLGNLDRHYSWNRDFNGAITWILTSFTTNIAQATISLDQSTFPRLAYQMSLLSTFLLYTHMHTIAVAKFLSFYVTTTGKVFW